MIPTLYFAAPIATPRESQRVAPTTNITDDMTWTHGRHTVTFGFNFHASENDNISFSNYPSYAFQENTLLGLGGDIATSVLNYVSPTSTLASTTLTADALGAMFGMLNQYSATYHYNSKAAAIPFGSPVTTAYEKPRMKKVRAGRLQNGKRNITITVGLRYSLLGVPYEINGTQVIPTTPLNSYFAQRLGAAQAGVSNSLVPDSLVSFALGGPVNNGPGYYPLDKGDWAPRFAAAYSPDAGSLIEKVMGKGSVFRAGWAMVYDHYGTHMAQSLASTGSPGLASAVSQPVNTDFTSSFRYTGGARARTPLPQIVLVRPVSDAPLDYGWLYAFSGVSSKRRKLRIPGLNVSTTPARCRINSVSRLATLDGSGNGRSSIRTMASL